MGAFIGSTWLGRQVACAWAGVLVGEPGVDGGGVVAAVAAEFEVGELVVTGCFADPGFGDVEEVGDFGRGEEPVGHAACLVGIWFPQLVQPGRVVRAYSSSLRVR